MFCSIVLQPINRTRVFAAFGHWTLVHVGPLTAKAFPLLSQKSYERPNGRTDKQPPASLLVFRFLEVTIWIGVLSGENMIYYKKRSNEVPSLKISVSGSWQQWWSMLTHGVLGQRAHNDRGITFWIKRRWYVQHTRKHCRHLKASRYIASPVGSQV